MKMSDISLRGCLEACPRVSKRTALLAGLILAAAGLSACSNDQDELKEYIAEVRSRPGGRIDPLPEVKPYETFVYNDQDLRSPFVQSAPEVVAGGVRPNTNRNREFLEQYSLDTLTMVGTLKIAGRTHGLVQTKDGLIHRVLPGNHLGQNDGKITEIGESKISLIEIVPDGMGGYIERPAALGLKN
jgi:type IV pilus assembly protein PilP